MTFTCFSLFFLALPSSLIICLMVRGAEESLRFVWPPVGYDLLAKGENISAQHKQSKVAIEKEIERKKKQKKIKIREDQTHIRPL